MIGNKRFLLTSVLVSSFIFLGACGESDKGSAAAPAAQPAPAPEMAVTEATSEETAFDISTVEKAEGVVYQDEIYANWPYN